MSADPDPSDQPRKALVAGASGLVGRHLLKLLETQRQLASLALVRRKIDAPMSWIEQLPVDFEQLTAVALPHIDLAFSCLGTTAAVAGSAEAFRHIDHELVLDFAHAAKGAGARCLIHISAAGSAAHSRLLYSRVKAETEAALALVGFESLVILKPSLLLGDRAALKQPRRMAEGMSQPLGALLAPLLPMSIRPIRADRVARLMLAYGLAAPAGVHLVESRELHAR